MIGAILIGNMAATVRDQLGYLILFSLAALFLLIRLHALDEQATWTRRRIGDPTAVRSLYLRGGTVFILIAVVGSLALTATARSAPLAGAWDDLKPALLDISAAIQRLPSGRRRHARNRGRPVRPDRGRSRRPGTQDDALALTIRRPPGDERPYYWRAVAYDRFNSSAGWEWTGEHRVTPRPAGDELLAGTLDAPRRGRRRRRSSSRSRPDGYRSPFVAQPACAGQDRPGLASCSASARTASSRRSRSKVTSPTTLTARVPLLGDDPPGALTQNALRVAGTDYPDEIVARLSRASRRTRSDPKPQRGPRRRPGQGARRQPVRRRRDDGPRAPGLALQVRHQRRRRRLRRSQPRPSASRCRSRGFCLHYATLMTLLLREHKIPARFVQGFLPGDINALTGVEEIPNNRAHAWVEVYFPGHGWVRSTRPAAASRRPSRCRRASRSSSPVRDARPELRAPSDGRTGGSGPRTPGPAPGPTSTDGSGGGAGAFIIDRVLLLGVVGGLAFVAWQRGPRGPTTPEGVYAGVARLAARLGFGPRPTQTAYEYATALGDVLPNIRPELQTVATAKVEVAYGRRTLGDDRIRALRESYRRLRVSLLRLLFRRRRAAVACVAARRAPRAPDAALSLASWAASSSSGARCSVRFIARTTGRPPRNSMTRDPAQVERPHPEPVERQVEEGQQQDLEDAVVADDDRPRAAASAASR